MSVIVNASTSTGLGITSDNSGSIVLQNNGSTKLTVDATGSYGTVTSATAQATTSGTSIDFTSIPSWVKRITILFNGVSTNGTSNLQVQIGSGSVETTGYSSSGTSFINAASCSVSAAATTGYQLVNNAGATAVLSGEVRIALLGSNLWIASGTLIDSPRQVAYMIAGTKTTSGTLDRIRLTTVAGTDTFDAGSVNILYEG